ncbi:A24 family peptidase [Micromonospora sp. CPCC 206060]|uniref:prepilin peptidase n=1 Tax=Micromonospora sp. CPCC 206060 TaxID=3122406 RepID=UPI002FF21F08
MMKSLRVTAPDRALRPARSAPLRFLAGLTLAPLLRSAITRHSVPAGQPPRVACDRCAAPIGPGQPLRPRSPVARCAACGARVGAPPYTVEIALIAAVVALLVPDRPAIELLAVAGWLALAVPLAFIDAAVHRLPDRFTLPAALGTWGLLGLAAVLHGDAASWLRAFAAGTGLALFFAASTLLLGRRGFGLGDAKLALSAGALLGWYGWGALIAGVFLTFVCAALVSLVLLVTGRVRWRGQVPFGPFLIVGTVAALVLTP